MKTALCITAALLLAACGQRPTTEPDPKKSLPALPTQNPGSNKSVPPEGLVRLSNEQIATAGIRLERPTLGGGGTLERPAIVEGDPDGTQVVSAAIGGRIVALTRNLGQSVSRGQTLAVIESREVAQLKGEVAASRARLALAESNLAREQRLFAERVSPEQDLVAARTTATEARIAYRLAQQQVAATGGGGDGLNRLNIIAPLTGQVIARPVVLGQTVAADTELFRVASLGRVSLSFDLQPADAGRVPPGASVTVSAPERASPARVTFVSPAVDPETRLVPVQASLDNRAGLWRVGEPVTARVALADSGAGSNSALRVPSSAVQIVEGRSVVFVRIPAGFRATPVTLGDTAGDTVTVMDGLAGSETIATTNSFTLKAELGKSEASDED